MLDTHGYKIFATEGTRNFLVEHGVNAIAVSWPDENDHNVNIISLLQDHQVDLVINIPKNHTKRELTNGYKIRRSAIDHIPGEK